MPVKTYLRQNIVYFVESHCFASLIRFVRVTARRTSLPGSAFGRVFLRRLSISPSNMQLAFGIEVRSKFQIWTEVLRPRSRIDQSK